MFIPTSRNMLIGCIVIISFLLDFSSCAAPRYSIHHLQRQVKITNDSGKDLEIYWVHPNTGETIKQTQVPMHQGDVLTLDTFVNHTFVVREISSSGATSCGVGSGLNGGCPMSHITVNEHEGQDFFVHEGLDIDLIDDSMCDEDLDLDCKAIVDKAMKGTIDPRDARRIINEYAACMKPKIAHKFEVANEILAQEVEDRERVAKEYEYYTCADSDLPTTDPIEVKSWEYEGITRTVNVLHERDASKVHVLKNFISEEECAAIEKAAQKGLHQATTADGKGGSMLNDSRKAMQAGVRVPWEKEKDGNPIAAVSRRLYEYINHATGFGFEEAGQEDLMSIQYFGRGQDDEAPDQYKPHCDGECTGLEHKTGGRVATMVMYCTEPVKGGATNFRNAGLHVKPEKGAAAFFSYLGSDGKMDKGFTEHSGCPVTEGEKKIAVQWLRLGVDEENPWDSFNTLIVKIDDEDM